MQAAFDLGAVGGAEATEDFHAASGSQVGEVQAHRAVVRGESDVGERQGAGVEVGGSVIGGATEVPGG